MSELKVATEVAEAEFDRWVDANALGRKLARANADPVDRKGVADNRSIIIGAIEDGDLVLNEENEFVFTPAIGERTPLKFAEPDGGMITAGLAKTGDSARLLAALTKTVPPRFTKMKARDLAVCDAIASLFLVK